jgi:hypothetical protein
VIRRQPQPPPKRIAPSWQSVLLMVLSLLLAALYWGYTVSEEKSLKDLSVPLEFANVPKDMIVIGDDVHRLVTVEIKGSPEMLRRVREEDVDAKIDVSKLDPGPQVIEIGQENVRLPSSVELARVFPKILHFTLDKKIQTTVPLEPTFTGHTAAGTQILSWSVDPPTTVIEGPETLIRRIRHAPTQPISLEGRAQDFQVPVVPTFSEPEISVSNLGPFTIRVSIGEIRSQRTITPVPVKVLNARYPTILATPSLRVMVDGPESVVRGLGPQDFVAEVDVVGLKPSDQDYQLRPAVRFANPNLASRVDITSWSQRFVVVRIEPVNKTPAPTATSAAPEEQDKGATAKQPPSNEPPPPVVPDTNP